jgi:hypothetical protein
MTSDRQIAANRSNAARSTGPRTATGKSRSRRNAYRHGLCAETVITAVEEPDKYQAFEAGLIEDYAPDRMVERELVARLASLLWRLRRATRIETGLFEMESRMLQQRHRDQVRHQADNPGLTIFYKMLQGAPNAMSAGSPIPPGDPAGTPGAFTNASLKVEPDPQQTIHPASLYLRLYRNNPAVTKRLARYETTLWRQLAQTLLMLETAKGNRFRWSKGGAR